ncbi:hypothetical protein HDU84_008516, partial [Entophlyctis sp. JEL0112]
MALLALLTLLACISQILAEKPIPSLRRIVAVGDFHGDLSQTTKVLQMAQVLDEKSSWINDANTVFVQTGDIVDRGPDTIALFELLRRVAIEASASDRSQRQVFTMAGNHEVMNLGGDWRYVTREDIESFGGRDERRKAWSADGWIGKLIMQEWGGNLTVEIDGTVFVHGGTGITPEWARLGVDGINKRASAAMEKKNWHDPIFGAAGPLWYRGYAQDSERSVCSSLEKALDLLNAKRMVIGHTPQLETRKILSRCDGRVFVIDVGISRAYGGACAALEIVGDTVTALYCAPGSPGGILRVDMTPPRHSLSPEDNEFQAIPILIIRDRPSMAQASPAAQVGESSRLLPRSASPTVRLHPPSALLVLPPLFLHLLAGAFGGTAFSQFIIWSTCIGTGNSSRTIELDAPTYKDCAARDYVQAEAALWLQIISLTQAIPAFFLIPVMGKLVDTFGRRTMMAVPIFAGIIDAVAVIMVAHTGASLLLIVLANLIQGLMGGGAVLTMASYAYVADTSTEANRVFLFLLIDVVSFTAFTLGPFLGGMIYR